MNDDEIIEELRRVGRTGTPVEVAEALGALWVDGLTHSALVMFFRRAFPDIPLKTMIDAGGWRRVSSGGISDEGFDQMLSQWLPSGRTD